MPSRVEFKALSSALQLEAIIALHCIDLRIFTINSVKRSEKTH